MCSFALSRIWMLKSCWSCPWLTTPKRRINDLESSLCRVDGRIWMILPRVDVTDGISRVPRGVLVRGIDRVDSG